MIFDELFIFVFVQSGFMILLVLLTYFIRKRISHFTITGTIPLTVLYTWGMTYVTPIFIPCAMNYNLFLVIGILSWDIRNPLIEKGKAD